MRRALHQVAVAVTTVAVSGWRRRRVVLAVAVVGLVVTLVVDGRRTPRYAGTAQLLVGPPPGSTTSTGSGAASVTPAQLADAAALLTSPQLRSDAATLLGSRAAPPARATAQAGTDVVTVTVDSPTARGAAADALAYVNAYLARQQLTRVDALEATASKLAGRIADLAARVGELDRRIVAAGGPAPTTTAPPTTARAYNLPGYTIPPYYTVPTYAVPSTAVGLVAPPVRLVPTGNAVVDDLQRQRADLVAQQSVLSQQAAALRDEATAFTGGGQLLAGGIPPTSPVSPRKTRDGVIGALVGLLLGGLVVGVLDWRRLGPVVPRLPERRTRPGTPSPVAASPTAGAAPATDASRTVVLRAAPRPAGSTATAGSIRFVRRGGPLAGAAPIAPSSTAPSSTAPSPTGPSPVHQPDPGAAPARRRRPGQRRRRAQLAARRHRARR